MPRWEQTLGVLVHQHDLRILMKLLRWSLVLLLLMVELSRQSELCRMLHEDFLVSESLTTCLLLFH